ncbi:MAG: DUF1348 family protein [Terriglobales bacterium]
MWSSGAKVLADALYEFLGCRETFQESLVSHRCRFSPSGKSLGSALTSESGRTRCGATFSPAPFTGETASLRVRLAEDGWNWRDPEKVALAYTRPQSS